VAEGLVAVHPRALPNLDHLAWTTALCLGMPVVWTTRTTPRGHFLLVTPRPAAVVKGLCLRPHYERGLGLT
jgi:hypothetical protein